MKLLIFPPLLLFSYWRDYFRQTDGNEMFSTNCQYHKLTIFCVFEAKSLWQQFGHPLNNLHMFWRSAAKYLRTILLSYCAARQNPSDWEEAFGVCSPELKTERYDKGIKNRCLPQCDAEHTWGSCLTGGESRLFFPLWCGRLRSLDGWLDGWGGITESFIKTCSPGNPSEQPEDKFPEDRK